MKSPNGRASQAGQEGKGSNWKDAGCPKDSKGAGVMGTSWQEESGHEPGEHGSQRIEESGLCSHLTRTLDWLVKLVGCSDACPRAL